MRIRPYHPIAAILPLAAVLVLAWWAYRPGLGGGFLFDDFANLPALGATGPVDNIATFWRYLTSGTADPTGRPLALLSFLLDADDWPAAAYPFKRTSVLLHLFNGALLARLLTLLGTALRVPPARAAAAAVLGAALWLLHPLFVSTTLYVVQREAMLPATFMLAGLIGYLGGRRIALRGQRCGAWLAGASIVLATALAVLSKANGALLPLLVWLTEAILLAPRQPVNDPRSTHAFTRMRWATLIAPSLLLLAYLARQTYTGFVHGVGELRPWTLGERLLTEARILVDYLGLLWLPRPYTAGLFNESFPVSTSLWSPPTTLPAIALIAALIGGAIALRRRQPALTLAVLFFFAAHLMESSVIPLELYFEHRNYVAALLMFWPLALWLCGASAPTPDVHHLTSDDASRRMRVAAALVLPLFLATLTWLRADLWGHPDEQALIWARKNPASPRAEAYAAQIELARGQSAAAAARLERALAGRPTDVQLALNLIGARCATGTLTGADIANAEYALRNEPNTGRLGYDWFERSLPTAQAGGCHGLDLAVLDQLLDAAANNPRAQKVPGRRQDVLHMQGRIALLHGDAAQAAMRFDQALHADLRPGAALQQAAMLASAGHPDLAQQHLDLLERIQHVAPRPALGMPLVHQWVLARQAYWPREIAHLREKLKAAMPETAIAAPEAAEASSTVPHTF